MSEKASTESEYSFAPPSSTWGGGGEGHIGHSCISVGITTEFIRCP